MSYTRYDVDRADLDDSRPAFLPSLGHVARLAVWAVLNAILVFGEHLAELFAPFLILAGVVWWATLHGLAAVTLEGQANDLLQMVRSHVPRDIILNGSLYSASSLIWDGILLIGVVAICRTLSIALATLLLDRR